MEVVFAGLKSTNQSAAHFTYSIKISIQKMSGSYWVIDNKLMSRFRVVSALGRFDRVVSARVVSANLGVVRFGLGRWVVSALGRFGPESFRPNFMVGYISIG